MNKKLSKTKEIALVIILILIAINLTVSYSYFSVNTTHDNTLSTISGHVNCLDITYEEQNSLNLSGQYPVSDEWAMGNLTPVTITVENNCENTNERLNYTLALSTLRNATGYINDNQVRMHLKRTLHGDTEKIFKNTDYVSSLTQVAAGNALDFINQDLQTRGITSSYTTITNYVLDSTDIGAGETNTYKLYLWIDYYEGDTTHAGLNDNTTQNKQYKTTLELVLNADDNVEQGWVDPNNYLDKARFFAAIGSYGANSGSIATVNFMNTTNVPIDDSCGEGVFPAVDVSEKQNGSIMMSMDTNDCQFDTTTFYVGQNGGVLAPSDSSNLLTRVDYANLTNLDTSHVTNMSGMFGGLSGFTNISNLDTSHVTNMSQMFFEYEGTGILDLRTFNTSNVTSMGAMFMESLISGVRMDGWNTSNVTNMNQMFREATNITSLDISSFTIGSQTDFDFMFLGMSSLTTIYASSDFPQSSTYGVLLDEDLFNGCVNLVGGNGTTYSQSHTDETYAKIDTPGTPGYFTLAS